MSSYKLIRVNELDLLVEKNCNKYMEVKLNQTYRLNFGFSAKSSDGKLIKYYSRGMFFWRKHFLEEDNKLVAIFKGNNCIYPEKIYFSHSLVVKRNNSILFEFFTSRSSSEICRWVTDDCHSELIFIALALLACKKGAYVPSI